MTQITFQAVSKQLGGRTVVQDVSLVLAPSERVALVGPSGCGKTTLLRLTAGLIAPDRGRIKIDDITVAENGRNYVAPEQRHVGMVFQDLALWPHLTAQGNLAFGLKARGVKRAERHRRIADMLTRMHLEPYAQTKPNELSGGEQQRVALARALILRPSLLLMDEPLSSLDPDLNQTLRGEILSLHRALGFTLLYVTHNPEEAAEIGQRCLEMKQGRLINENQATAATQKGL
ncbi:ABC transporter ATP-binding protein [Planctomycetota bacterium]